MLTWRKLILNAKGETIAESIRDNFSESGGLRQLFCRRIAAVSVQGFRYESNKRSGKAPGGIAV